MVAAAMIGAAVVGAAASSNASSKASKAQQNAARAAGNVEMEQYYQNRDDQAPWRNAGQQGLDMMMEGLGRIPQTEANFDAAEYLRRYPGVAADPYYKDHPFEHYMNSGAAEGTQFTYNAGAQAAARAPGFGDFNRDFTLADFTKDPGYDFRMQQGTQALDRSAAARGGALGGAAIKAAQRYGQDFASNEYQNAYNRFNNDRTQRFNRLASLAGIGQTATRDVAQQGAQVASNVAGNMIGAGNSQAAGYIAQGNAVSGAANSLGNWAMYQSMNQQPQQQWYNNGQASNQRVPVSNSVQLSDGTTFYN